MQQIESKIKWCLQKAEKEIAQGRKHRGLIKITPDVQEAKKHLSKAEHNFKAVVVLEKAGLTDWSVSACFYTIYHCFLAIIKKNGYESRNQECTIALVQQLKMQGLTKLDDSIINAFEPGQQEEMHESSILFLRENFQYGTETIVEDKKLKALKDTCKRVIEQAKQETY